MKNSDKTLWFFSSLFGSVSVAKALVFRDHQHLIRAPCPLWAVPSLCGPRTTYSADPEHVESIWDPGICPHFSPRAALSALPFPALEADCSGCHPTICYSLPAPSHLPLPEPQLFSAGTEIFTSSFTNSCSWLKCLIFPLLFPYT